MANLKARRGRASELQVVGQMLDAGLDCYLTLVDDQAIDAVLRVPREKGSARYYDVQVKGGRSWSDIRGRVSNLAHRPNAILVLNNSSTGDSFWLDATAIRNLFPATGFRWGDVYIRKATVAKLKLYTLRRLMKKLGVGAKDV
jgi:hypothetical protein